MYCTRTTTLVTAQVVKDLVLLTRAPLRLRLINLNSSPSTTLTHRLRTVNSNSSSSTRIKVRTTAIIMAAHIKIRAQVI